jgi:hypothetical protein
MMQTSLLSWHLPMPRVMAEGLAGETVAIIFSKMIFSLLVGNAGFGLH